MKVVVEKETFNKGKYLTPLEYGKPITSRIGYNAGLLKDAKQVKAVKKTAKTNMQKK